MTSTSHQPAATPPYLTPGDTIALVCPAGYMPLERVSDCIATLKLWGYQVLVGSSVGHQHHYFSGTDHERLADLQQMLDNPTVNAILCARGGYGTSRIIDSIKWDAFKAHPKWIVGYSDVTVLHSVLFSQLQMASMHAPMAVAFQQNEWQNPYVQSLKQALSGAASNYEAAAHPKNRPGLGTGPLVGGNLSLLAHQIGTPSDLNLDGKILFLEDVGEYLYNIDRMLVQMARAGKLARLAGAVVGGFSDCKDTTEPFGDTVENIIFSHFAPYNYPVCFGFPVSHTAENYCLKSGLIHQLTVGSRVSLAECMP
jgi:muramoyltetrapeptide carboxypeptidase